MSRRSAVLSVPTCWRANAQAPAMWAAQRELPPITLQESVGPVRSHASRSICEPVGTGDRSEEHTSELQSLMRISYAVFCLKKKNNTPTTKISDDNIYLL